MPRYAKFLKELLTNKRKVEEVAADTLNEECFAIISNRIPKKEKDPEVYHPVYYWGMLVEKALADPGESINLIPYKIFQNMGLDLDDRAVVPLILGRPFLATSQDFIDVKDGQMDPWVEDDLSNLLDDKGSPNGLVEKLHPQYNIEENEREMKFLD
ncbi:uncharacterized protein LOC120265053 [Dioscorea cayenensis subsp. rotundata]|uniref:Uncharacterized protein LOC120265053 n=1 Tax=Dioscorea cayennensis subsp. rotundata TaxID=55577 RepID=A0AB40BQM4_DIOCR|nr:uncharacterized protein LOC120265053 [Dioscorea cayenensis subsp. rotundata]